MKVVQEIPAVSNETRKKLREHLEIDFKVDQGDDLDSVILEVLKDRDLFTFLAVHLPENKGIKVGQITYFDDADVNVYYGLCLSMKVPRKTSLFGFRNSGHPNYGIQQDLIISCGFPRELIPGRGTYQGLCPPSPARLVKEVNEVLSLECLKDHVIDLQMDKLKYKR